MTSPPFLALRSYLPADHPDKGKEIGSEPTPGEFIDALLDVTEELARVVAPHGSICVELGDTYSGSGGAGGDYGNPDKTNARRDAPAWSGSAAAARSSRPKYAEVDLPVRSHNRTPTPGWPMDKSLTMIPELFRMALTYGFNPLTGRETEPWRVRNVVRWHRPNPPVGSLADKFRPATSDMVVACKSRTRYFDLDAVRGPGSENTHARTAKGVDSRPTTGKAADDEKRGGNFSTLATVHDTNGAPPLDTWVIPTAPFKGSHYATFPAALCVKPILAMCPEWVCTICGEPSRRIVDSERVRISDGTVDPPRISPTTYDAEGNTTAIGIRHAVETTRTTTGWTECECFDTDGSKWRKGVVLDPFAGSGTTLAVATGHGRDAIGIDLDVRNLDLCRERVGMFLEVVESVKVPA